MQNYFEFYEIPISFSVDETALKSTFYANSKKYHPDFFTLASAEKQQEVLELSTLNNEAYKTLRDEDKRMKYILELKGMLAEEGNNNIPQDFLMEMMDINEALMELEFDFNAEKHKSVTKSLKKLEDGIYDTVKTTLESYNDNTSSTEQLTIVKEYYLKKRYLLRIQENLNKFAST